MLPLRIFGNGFRVFPTSFRDHYTPEVIIRYLQIVKIYETFPFVQFVCNMRIHNSPPELSGGENIYAPAKSSTRPLI